MSDKRLGSSSGLTLVTDAGTAFVSSKFNSGHMVGDIKLAALSDSDATNVTGTELVTNGTFDTDTSGWSFFGSTTLSVVSGELQSAATGIGGPYQLITTVIGQTYTVSFDVSTLGSNFEFWVGSSGEIVNQTVTTTGTYSYTFTATAASTQIYFRQVSAGTNLYDNISVRLAEEDRSVSGNGLQVFGTVTKTAVATGADLVAYSGFSTSNMLIQPYNPDLNVGTGDFCFMGWAKVTNNTLTSTLFDYADSSSTGRLEVVYLTSIVQVAIETSYLTFGAVPANNTWAHIAATRTNGQVSCYVNGELRGTQTKANSIGSVNHKTWIGTNYLGNSNGGPSLALFRFSATAPTAEQIAKIYEDEKVLFQDGAQATLYGSSDAVTALAYDEDTELLHVGTSAGRSVFQGLRRVDNTTDAVGSCISAVNNLVAED